MKTERYSHGKWNVLSDAPYPARIGHIAGGKGRYCAERGALIVGYFQTLKGAAKAIEAAQGYCGGDITLKIPLTIEDVRPRSTGTITGIE